jgi:hypothetical protein
MCSGIFAGFSRSATMAAKKRAASPPFTARWSKVRERGSCGRITGWLERATTRFLTQAPATLQSDGFGVKRASQHHVLVKSSQCLAILGVVGQGSDKRAVGIKDARAIDLKGEGCLGLSI